MSGVRSPVLTNRCEHKCELTPGLTHTTQGLLPTSPCSLHFSRPAVDEPHTVNMAEPQRRAEPASLSHSSGQSCLPLLTPSLDFE